jgi:spermidine synthase
MRWQRQRNTYPRADISEKKGVRYLHLGGPAVQSAMRLNDPFGLELEYTRAMMSFLLFQPAPRRACLIGLGGGSIAKFFHRRLVDTRLVSVEINPEVVAAAHAYFNLPPDDERLSVLTADGAAYVFDHAHSQDVLMIDGYDAKRIVEDLASPPFLGACRAMLNAGGVALFDLWGSDKSFDLYLQRIDAAFSGHTLLLPSERKSNIIVLAFEEAPQLFDTALELRAEQLALAHGLEFPDFLQRMRRWNGENVPALAS